VFKGPLLDETIYELKIDILHRGSHIFRHTLNMFKQQGYIPSPVELQVSFGKDRHFWTNVYPSPLIERHQSEIKRFYVALKVARWTQWITGILPISAFMKLFRFSDDFVNYLILPAVALFLGKGCASD
jgi:hypothetical protein